MKLQNRKKPSCGSELMGDAVFLEHTARELLPYIKMLQHYGFTKPSQYIAAAQSELLRLANQQRLQFDATSKLKRNAHAHN